MTEPLVPADADVRGFKDMPMEVSRLLSSETWIMCTPEERSAAINLWFHSWTQVPAGSLPDNDRVLAHLSMASERWPEVKEMALRGWVKADDGRLYHTVVCEKVNAMLAVRARKSDAGRKGGSVSKPLKAKRKTKEEAVAKQQLNDSQAPDKLQPSSLPFPSLPIPEEKDSSLPLVEAPDETDKALAEYQRIAERCGLPKIAKLTDKRKSHLRARLADFGLDGWTHALRSIPASPFLTGKNDRGWKPDFDWLVNPTNLAKVIEGKYAGGTVAKPHAGVSPQARPGEYQARDPADFDLDDWAVRIRLCRENGKWADTWGERPPMEGEIAEIARTYLNRHKRAA